MKSKKIQKRGVSAVVGTVLLIAMAMALTGIVWLVVTNLVNSKLDTAGECLDVGGKVTINNDYTCYNSTTNELRFSLNVGEINLTSVLVGIAGSGTSISLEIPNASSQVPNVVAYPSGSTNVSLPPKNGGRTYLIDLTGAGFPGVPVSVQIIPIVGSNHCEISDTVSQIDDCLLFVQ